MWRCDRIQVAVIPGKSMISPPYSLLLASDKGRCAGYDHAAAVKRYPLASPPRNPFPTDDPADKRHVEWAKAFKDAVERFGKAL